MGTRLLLVTVVLGLLAAMPALAELPKTLDEMKAIHEQAGLEPQGAVKCFLDACFVYMNPETRGAGREMLQFLAIPLKPEASWDTSPGNRLFVDRLTDPNYAHVWRSYAVGATPQNGYQMDPNNWELSFERTYRHDNDDRGTQVYLRSGGADAPRVVYVKQSTTTGLWYVNIWNNLYVDIRPSEGNPTVEWEPVTGVEVPEGLPKTLNELRALHQQIGNEPQGGVKCFINACFAYMNEETRDEGRQMLGYMALPLWGDDDWDTASGNRLFVERLGPDYAHIWRSYAVGATPENAYQMDPDDWELNFERTHQHEEDERGLQVYLRSGGADSPRVIYVKQNPQSGLWHAAIWHTLFVGVKPPVDPNVEQFN